MSEEELPPVKRKRTRRPQLTWPMKATITVPGHKPIVIQGIRYSREAGRLLFVIPDSERPFIQKTLVVYEVPGLMVEIEEFVQPSVQQQPQISWTGNTQTVSEPHQQELERKHFRSRVGPNQMPMSEALDEAGNPIIVPAAFGLAVG